MKIFDRINEIGPEILEAGGNRVDIYEASKKFIKVGGTAIALGLAADAAGKRWGAGLALAGAFVEWCGGATMAFQASRLREESKDSSIPNHQAQF